MCSAERGGGRSRGGSAGYYWRGVKWAGDATTLPLPRAPHTHTRRYTTHTPTYLVVVGLPPLVDVLCTGNAMPRLIVAMVESLPQWSRPALYTEPHVPLLRSSGVA